MTQYSSDTWTLSDHLWITGGHRSITFRHKTDQTVYLCYQTWKTLYDSIPAICQELSRHNQLQTHWKLHDTIFVALDKTQNQTCLALISILDSGKYIYHLPITLVEWKSLVTQADSIEATLKPEQPLINPCFTSRQLVEQCVYFLLDQVVNTRKMTNCQGCRSQGGDKILDHMNGCFMEWTKAVQCYWTDALTDLNPYVIHVMYNRLVDKLQRPGDRLTFPMIQAILNDFRPDQETLNILLLPDTTCYYLTDIYKIKYCFQ